MNQCVNGTHICNVKQTNQLINNNIIKVGDKEEEEEVDLRICLFAIVVHTITMTYTHTRTRNDSKKRVEAQLKVLRFPQNCLHQAWCQKHCRLHLNLVLRIYISRE